MKRKEAKRNQVIRLRKHGENEQRKVENEIERRKIENKLGMKLCEERLQIG